MTDRYAVVGHPVTHSRSPYIHARFAEETRQDLRYDALDVAPGDFATAVVAFRDAGGRGLNVTVPFKREAWALAWHRTPRAERAGAVNTLWFEQGRVLGDNTDGVGLLRDLADNQGWPLAGARLLMLGAGGAARGVLGPLLEARPSSLVIANRTAERAQTLAETFGGHGALRGCGLDELAGERFDLVVNATSASLAGELPPLPDDLLADGAACYDMMYAAGATPFLAWAAAQGASRCADGLGMLVEQAAESFLRWRGMRPSTTPVIAALRQLMAQG